MPSLQGDETWIADQAWVKREGVKTFAAQPLIFQGEVLGVVALFDTGVLGTSELQWLRILADHAAVSIANARAFAEISALKDQLEEENERLREEFRDLFDEAPIPYVHGGLDSRFIRANQAALQTLGIKAEEVTRSYGKSLVADRKLPARHTPRHPTHCRENGPSLTVPEWGGSSCFAVVSSALPPTWPRSR